MPEGYVSSSGEVDKFSMTTGVSTGTAIVEGAYKSYNIVRLYKTIGNSGVGYDEADDVKKYCIN